MGRMGNALRGAALCAAALGPLGLAPSAFADAVFVNSTADTDSGAGCPAVQRGELPSDRDPAGTTCTLRAALRLTAVQRALTIEFNVSGPFYVATPLPPLAGGGSLAGGRSPAGMVDVVGGALGEGVGFPGLALTGAADGVDHVAVHGFSDGITLGGSGGHVLEGVYAGLTPAGSTPRVRNTGAGIHVLGGSVGNVIGRPEYDNPTWASGNAGWGIVVDPGATGTNISSAHVGLDPGDTRAEPNGAGGISVQSDGNAIGAATPCTTGSATSSRAFACTSTFVAGNGGPGIVLGDGTTGNTVVDTYVGVDGSGVTAVGNGGAGLIAGGQDQVIGKATDHGWVVVGASNGPGILLRGVRARVTNARVGTDAAAQATLSNRGAGIVADDGAGQPVGSHVIVGGVVSGNYGPGVDLRQASVTVRGNSLSRNGEDGVRVRRGPAVIGGSGAAANTIADNAGAGVAVVEDPAYGTPTGVTANGNSIVANGKLGIDLWPEGVTPNDAGDADEGPNHRQNAPIITSASAADGRSSFHGTLDSTPSTTFSITISRSSACDPSGYGEGATQVASGTVTTNAQGQGSFGFTTAATFAAGDVITALATSPAGDTSEYSPCFTAGGGADLAVSQRVVGSPPLGGKDFTVVADVVNRGPMTSTHGVLTEVAPTGTTIVGTPPACETPSGGTVRCALEDLAPAGKTSRSFVLRPQAAGPVTNHVAVSADEIDPTAPDNQSDLALTIGDAGTDGDGNGSPLDEVRPTFGASLRLDAVTGVVTATLPNGRAFSLSDATVVPVGTTIDATNGVAQVTAAQPSGATIHSRFTDARFRVRQIRAEKGVTEAQITTPLTCTTRKAKSGSRTLRAQRKKRRRTTKRHLWGDGKGHWRIRGRYASAAVRGTHWRVLDTCTSSEVYVQRGVVVATSHNLRGKPKRRILTAGQRVTYRKTKR